MAPKGGIEPPTKRLTVSCATATLLRNKLYFWKHTKSALSVSILCYISLREFTGPLTSHLLEEGYYIMCFQKYKR